MTTTAKPTLTRKKSRARMPGVGAGNNPNSRRNLIPQRSGEPAVRLKHPPPGALDKVRELAALGWTMDSIGRVAVNMSAATWGKWRKAHPEWEAAVQEGRDALHDKMVNTLTKSAGSGSVVPAMFLLKTRFGYRENDVPRDTRPQITINLRGALSPEAYANARRAVIEHEAAALPAPDEDAVA